jgi:hypothetical protein
MRKRHRREIRFAGRLARVEITRTWMAVGARAAKNNCWGRFYRKKEFSHAVEQNGSGARAFLGVQFLTFQ